LLRFKHFVFVNIQRLLRLLDKLQWLGGVGRSLSILEQWEKEKGYVGPTRLSAKGDPFNNFASNNSVSFEEGRGNNAIADDATAATDGFGDAGTAGGVSTSASGHGLSGGLSGGFSGKLSMTGKLKHQI
jgi:hypothetical protein